MADVFIFDQDGNLTGHRVSAHTPDFAGRQDVLINPDLSKVKGVPLYHLKAVNGEIVEKTQQEKDAVDNKAITDMQAHEDQKLGAVLTDLINALDRHPELKEILKQKLM